jgi:hypothetical protein
MRMLFVSLTFAFMYCRFVPKYLLPRGMQVADMNRKRKRRRGRKGNDGLKRSDNDPLQNFDGGDVNLDGVAGDDDEDMPDFSPAGDQDAKRQKGAEGEKKLYATSVAGAGKSTAGRQAWKEKHRKGAFSGKQRKGEKKKKQPMGI